VRRLAPTRKVLGIAAASTVVFVAGAASAWSSPSATTTTSSTSTAPTATGPAAYFVLNATADAASDHEIVGSSAFPNYTTGAVDNYYAKAHTHVDNAPFAEGTASPADTGPVGQTAAAGNFQQPQYADARWPGDPPKATYGTPGQPYAVATADDYAATAESSEASSGLSGTSGTQRLAAPKGFDTHLRAALAAWKAKWLGRLQPATTPKKPKVTIPAPAPAVPPVTTPAITVATPAVTVGSVATVPSVTVPPVVPSGLVPKSSASRSLQSSSAPPDGATLLHSTSETVLDPKTNDLVTRGESSLGRVSIGGGQIVFEGIHVTAQIANDGTPTDKESISVASASIGGIPVTIDQDGVHVAGKGQGLPYQQASDALNGALKSAGIRVYLVSPEVTHGGSGGQGGGIGPGLPIGSSTTTTDTTTTDTTTTGTTSTDTTTTDMTTTGETGTTSSLTGSCSPTSTTGGTEPTGTGTTTTTTSTSPTTTTTGPVIPIGGGSGAGTTTTDTTSTTDTNATTNDTSAEETVIATGVHVAFTQPVEAAGVPAQYVEHILGEVYVDSLAQPASALPDLGLDLSTVSGDGSLFGSSSGASSGSCLTGGRSGTKGTKSSGGTLGGGSTGGGPTPPASSSAPSSSGFASGSSQPTSGVLAGSTGEPVAATGTAPAASPMGFLSALKKPLWLLVIYLVWQVLMLVTGVSVWHWYRGGTS
jgi:hypothetical protein